MMLCLLVTAGRMRYRPPSHLHWSLPLILRGMFMRIRILKRRSKLKVKKAILEPMVSLFMVKRQIWMHTINKNINHYKLEGIRIQKLTRKNKTPLENLTSSEKSKGPWTNKR